ncbi:MAG: sensor domain-containing diguanylate cyclase [Burkholderiaceae bacterium]
MKPSFVRVLLVSLLLAVQLATVALVVMGMQNQTADHVADVARQGLEQFGKRVSRRANQLTTDAGQAVASGQQLIASGVLDAGSDKAVESFLLAQLRAFPQLARMQLARSDGSLIDVARESEGFRSRLGSQQGGSSRFVQTEYSTAQEAVRIWVDPSDQQDPRLAPWYAAARQGSRPVWTGLVATDQQGPQVITVATITSFPNTTDAGVLSASVTVRAIAAQLSGLELPGGGSVALTDTRGNALAYLSGTALKTAFDPGRVLSIEQTVQSPIRDLFAQLGIDLVTEDSPLQQWRQKSGFASYLADGKEFFGLASPVEIANGQMTWLLTTAIPSASYMGGLGELFKRKMHTLLAVILIPALIAVLALFGLNEPATETKEEDTGTDEVTGFLTRAEFRRRLEGMLRNRRELEYGGRIVVVAMDMDGFQKLVSRYGAGTGDATVRQFSRRLRNRVRQHDLLGRSGADKFLVALRVDRGADVLTTVNRIRRATVVKPFVTASGRHILGVTAGIATVDPNESVDDLLARAEQALVTGKVRQRDRSYLAAAPDTTWPQTGVALPDDTALPRDQRSPTLEI